MAGSTANPRKLVVSSKKKIKIPEAHVFVAASTANPRAAAIAIAGSVGVGQVCRRYA